MKIALIGNCQASIATHCVMFLTGAKATHVHYDKMLEACGPSREKLKAYLADFDVTITQDFGEPGSSGIGTSDIAAAARRCIAMPKLFVSAFHPDLVYVNAPQDQGGVATVYSPIGPYHSAIAVYAYKAGYSLEQTMSLFRRDVYERLGFRRLWLATQQNFFAQCQKLGFPGEQAFVSWARTGNFMHSINHPKLFVIEDMTRILMSQIGLTCRTARCVDHIHDGLLDIVWPVYPEVGEVYGITGSYTFRRAGHVPPPADGYPQFQELDEYIAGCFELYEAYGPDRLISPRVDAFLASPDSVAALKPI